MAKINPVQMQKHLQGMSYPARKNDIIRFARQNGADESALKALNELPDEQFQTPADVSKAMSQIS